MDKRLEQADRLIEEVYGFLMGATTEDFANGRDEWLRHKMLEYLKERKREEAHG